MGTVTESPIDPRLLEPVLAPLAESRSLPAEAYTSPAVLEWELERFFDGGWTCAARSAEVSAPGDQTAIRAGSESVLLTRAGDGALRAFFNVCRHRGHEVLPCGSSTNLRVIRCPYHGWVYGLDGGLRAAPRFAHLRADDPARQGLVPVRVREWHGWAFVNVSGDAPDLDEHVGNLDELVAPYRSESLVTAAVHEYEVRANWKIVVENYHECYHCTQIHPELCRVTPPTSGESFVPTGLWVGGSMDLKAHADTMSLSGQSAGEILPGLGERQARQVYYYGLFPNLLISPHPDYVMTHLLEPLGPDRTRIECRWLFRSDVAGRAGFDPSYAVDFWDITNRQDWGACESVQRGAASRGYRQGPMAVEEDNVHQFQTMVARGYLQGRPAAPDPPARVAPSAASS